MEPFLSQLSWFLLFAFSMQGITAIGILLFKSRPLRTANVLLAINLLGISMVALVITLVESGLILRIPHFYRVPSPLYYLMFPAAYLYVKIHINRTHLTGKDYLHFIPAGIHLLELTPFYLQRAETKTGYILEAMQQHIQLFEHGEGWLPPYWHNIIRGGLGILYGVLMWRVIWKKSADDVIRNPFARMVVRWLKTIATINLAIGFFAILFLTLVFIPSPVRSAGLSLVFLGSLSVANFYLFFRPEILYGLPDLQRTVSDEKDSIQVVMNASRYTPEKSTLKPEVPDSIYQYRTKVHQYMVQSGRYLDPALSIQDISRETGIPIHHLQVLIRKVEKMKINEYINGFRIQHIAKLAAEGGTQHKTLEGLAIESGFGSKATFIRAVKKLTGKTPKEYFAQPADVVPHQIA